MYKVIIVDDESWIVENLKISIDWQAYGFQVVDQAYNGIEASEKILQWKPDLVFTDIRMPGMNGLELVHKSTEASPGTNFVIISGYAEFAYAQKALNYGVVGYCLKPFDEVEIVNMLKKAGTMLDKSSEVYNGEMLSLLEEQGIQQNIKIKENLLKQNLQWSEKEGLAVVTTVGGGIMNFPKNVNYVCLKISRNKHAYLLQSAVLPGLQEFFSNTVGGAIQGIGIGGPVYFGDCMKEVMEEAETAAYQFFICKENRVHRYSAESHNRISEHVKQLEAAISEKNSKAIHKAFQGLAMMFSAGKCNIRYAFQVYNIIMAFICRLGYELSEEYACSYEQLIRMFSNVSDMLSSLEDQLIESLGTRNALATQEIKNETFRLILNHIDKNFHTELSIQELSKLFTINPNYISQLFKKETGKTFTEYLTELRITYACELLKSSSLSISEVAEKSGYSDYFYFCRAFKKNCGKTPSEYRSNI